MFVERAAGILLFDRNLREALLIQDRKGVGRFPSGRNLPDEPLLDAAFRELWEETGIDRQQIVILAPPIPLASARVKPGKGRFTKLAYLFPAVLAEDRSTAIRIAEKELLDARFVRLDDLEATTKSRRRFAALTLAYAALHASLECGFDPVEALV